MSVLTVLDMINRATDYLEEKNILNARRNAEELLSFVFGKSRIEIYLDGNSGLDNCLVDKYIHLLEKRSQGYPLQYIIKSIEFLGLNLGICEGVFIPRPETEILVETVIRMVKLLNPVRSINSNGVNCQMVKLLEIGTGSGCIAISLAKFIPAINIIATDISPLALKIAQENSRLNETEDKIEFVPADLFNLKHKALNIKQFDLIVSNPPYISETDFGNLAPEIFYEPRIAWDGGKDGLFYIREIIAKSVLYLRKDGILVLEIGFDQAEAVRKIFAKSKFNKIEFIKDYQGIERVVILCLENRLMV